MTKHNAECVRMLAQALKEALLARHDCGKLSHPECPEGILYRAVEDALDACQVCIEKPVRKRTRAAGK